MRVRTRTCSNKAACMHQDVCRMNHLRDMCRHARTCARVRACVRARSHEVTCRTRSQLTPARARPLPPTAIGDAQATSLRSLNSTDLGHAASLAYGLALALKKSERRS